MITQATKSGADAVIILSFRRVPLNDEQRVVETIETKDGE
jgi:uncharacterized protein YbjQ (UPF0145 family)